MQAQSLIIAVSDMEQPESPTSKNLDTILLQGLYITVRTFSTFSTEGLYIEPNETSLSLLSFKVIHITYL